MDDYQRFISVSRYARYLPEEKRRETWRETVVRYVDYFQNKYPEFPYEEVFEAIYNLEVMPSMRALMTAGKALDRDNAAGYNCFRRNTEFITSEGIKSFEDFEHGDEVQVLSNGVFKTATVVNFGRSKLTKLIVKKSSTFKEIFTTENHRWITLKSNGTGKTRVEKTTNELNPGDVLKRAPKSMINAKYPMSVCNIGIMHGLTFGDGTLYKGSTRITLCDAKIALKDFFTTGSHSQPQEDRYTITQLPWNWKDMPPIDANRSYLMGFIMGWFATDGYISGSGHDMSVSSRNYDTLKWLKGVCCKFGIFTKDIKGGERRDPFDPSRMTTLFSLGFYAETVPAYFFLNDKHKERFESSKVKDKFEWRVHSVEECSLEEDVWCVQVPETESFTLECGIETKNCSALAVDDARAFDETMYLSMSGCGVGFSVERQFINKLPVIAEEFYPTDSVIHVKDSKIGWASALRELVSLLYGGLVPKWDLSALRPSGAPLKTFGGRSSGPEPLDRCFKFFVATFKQAAGRKLNSIECHDLMCKIGEIVVVGGVRRCRVEDELIQMSDGSWKQLNQVTVGEKALMPDGSDAVISNVFDNGIQEVVKLHLEDGSYFECTPEHVWLVFNHDTNLLEEIQTRNLPLGNYSMVFPE